MSLGLRESGSVWIIPPEVSVSNGDHITLIKEDRGVIGDGGTIELGVVGLTQCSNVDHPIGDLNLELCMLSDDSRKVDLDVTSLGGPLMAKFLFLRQELTTDIHK